MRQSFKVHIPLSSATVELKSRAKKTASELLAHWLYDPKGVY